MINGTELRIGNWIRFVDQEMQVLGILSHEILVRSDFYSSLSPENLDPLPLTEEWLTKWGFDQLTWGDWDKSTDSTYFMLRFSIDKGWRYHNGYFVSRSIIFVHELQNLYFALTGQELENAT